MPCRSDYDDVSIDRSELENLRKERRTLQENVNALTGDMCELMTYIKKKHLDIFKVLPPEFIIWFKEHKKSDRKMLTAFPKRTKRYLLFAGLDDNGLGGWNDFIEDGDDLSALRTKAKTRKYAWAQVIDTETKKDVLFLNP